MAFAVLLIYICYMLIEGSLNLCNFWQSVFAVPCFAKKAMLFLAVKFKACARPVSLHTSNELANASPSAFKKRCGSEREVFCARFATFCRAFQNTFYPMLAHFSTCFIAGFLPGGRVGWTARSNGAPAQSKKGRLEIVCK